MGMRAGYRQSYEHVRRRMASRLATLGAKPKPVSREWLVSEYVDAGRNCVQIGEALGRDPKTIWAWLKHYDIATRPRGTATPSWRKRGAANPFAGHRHSDATKQRIRAVRLMDGHVPYLLKDGSQCIISSASPRRRYALSLATSRYSAVRVIASFIARRTSPVSSSEGTS